MKILKTQEGFSLVELLVAISFISVSLMLIFSLSSSNNKLRQLNEEKTQAIFFASQAIETVKLIEWSGIANGDYHLQSQGSTWTLAPSSELLAGRYTRVINISDVKRVDTNNGQVYGPFDTNGFVDPDTKKVTVTMTWPSHIGSNKQEVLESYVYHWQADRWTQTDWVGGTGQADWSDHAKFFTKDAGVDVATPGIATLLAGFLDWNQATTTANFDTPGNFDDNDVFEKDGTAYLVTENNASGSEFFILDVTDNTKPIQLSSLNIGAGVTSVVVKGDYAYVSTRSDSQELRVINVTNKNSPSIVFSYSLPGNSDAQDLTVGANQLYIVQGSTLYSFDINNPVSPNFLDSVSVGDTAKEVFLAEHDVYIATDEDDKELQIVDVTNPANIFLTGQYNLPGSLKGTDVNVRGNRAYISTQNNGSGAEFFIFDITNPSVPVYIGNYEMGETIYSFSIIGPYALLGTNFLSKELEVVDVSFPSTITHVAGFALSGHILGMSADCATIYAATSSNQGEFFIISTQVVDCGYYSSGILESSTFDTASATTTYNWIAWTGSAPLNTSIRFQLATSNNINGPWSYVGPDGSSGTYYTNAAKENINYNTHLHQRYARYKLFLNSNASLQAPILEEVIISHSIH